MNELRIRTMRPDEIPIAVEWAAAEGWNPGLANSACFATVNSDGFLVGELDGAPVATVSCINYDARFAFLGFYIVRRDVRGRGYGLRIWNAAMSHAGARVIGLDGVVGQRRTREVGVRPRLCKCPLQRHRRRAHGPVGQRHPTIRRPVRGCGGIRQDGVPGAARGVSPSLDRLAGTSRSRAGP